MDHAKEIIQDIYGNEYQERLTALNTKQKNTSAIHAASKIQAIDDKLVLHLCAAHFEVSEHCIGGSLEIPKAILHHPLCDFGTALMMFYKLGGLDFLYRQGDAAPTAAAKWIDKTLAKLGAGSFEYEKEELLQNTYDKILGQEYTSSEISYQPKLSLVERSTLNRRNPSVDKRLLEKTVGKEYEWPKVWYKPLKRK